MTRVFFHGFDVVDAVTAQIGRRPSIEFSVEVVCPLGWPAVLKNSPISPAGEPNPNLYYLSCPYLVKELSRLEDTGGITQLNDQLAGDSDLREALLDAQARHRRLWQQQARGEAAAEEYPAPAIAGTSELLHVKCLHAHFAFFLAQGGYPLGELIAGMLPGLWCNDELCRTLVSRISRKGG